MIAVNSEGQAISKDFIDAVSQPMVSYDMALMRDGARVPWTIQRATLVLGAGSEGDSLAAGLPVGAVLSAQMDMQLFEASDAKVGQELEVRLGVEVSEGAWEYVTVAWVTLTSCRTRNAITSALAQGRIASRMGVAVGITGDKTPAQVATAIQAATGVAVAIGDFASKTTPVTISEGMTCRDALAAMATRLGGFAAETHDGGVLVSPFASEVTYEMPQPYVLSQVEDGAYVVDGLTVEAAGGPISFGTGRLAVGDATATQETAGALWSALEGYSYHPGTVDVAIVDPRVTPFDEMGGYGSGNPNLSPFFSHSLADIYNATTNPGGYFAGDPTKSVELGVVGTQLDDGWMHVELDNSARTAQAWYNLYQRPFASLKPATAYTLLIELRNATRDGNCFLYSQADSATNVSQTVNPNGSDNINIDDGTYRKALVTKPDLSGCTLFCRQTIIIAAGKKASFDIRLSLYETIGPEILLDTNAPTLEKVEGPAGRYFSDTSHTQVAMSYGEIQDPPEELGAESRYGYTADYDGSFNGARTRALVFYASEADFYEAGRQYQATWWARAVSGTAYGRVNWLNTTSSAAQPTSNTALAYTTEWRRYTASVRPSDPKYSRVWFYATFAANTAGKVEICGFSLVEMDAEFKPYDRVEMPTQGIVATYDGGYFGTYAAPGMSAEAEDALVPSPTDAKVQQGVEASKAYTDEEIDAIEIGGRNLITLEETVNGYVNNSTGAITAASSSMDRTSGFIPVEPGETYTLQSWCAASSSQKAWAAIGWYDSSEAFISRPGAEGPAGTGYAIFQAKAPSSAAYARVSWRTFGNGYAKLERGTKPTDYTAAPEDLEARPNLTPFGSHSLTDVYNATSNPDGYWKGAISSAYVTQLGEGWLHFERSNAGTGNLDLTFRPIPLEDVEPGDALTLLIEVRNNKSAATSGVPLLYAQQTANTQIWGAVVQTSNLSNNSTAYLTPGASWVTGESFVKRSVVVVDSAHKTGDYIELLRLCARVPAGATIDCDFRVSVYRGGYGGEYVAYAVSDVSGIRKEAETALGIAEATNQHFWTDDSGAHVTDMAQDEWLAAQAQGFPDVSDSKPYANLLLNSLGMLIRSALSNLVSVGRDAVEFFDGLGNGAANIVASFGRELIRIGRDASRHLDITSGEMALFAEDGETKAFSIATESETDVLRTKWTTYTVQTSSISVETGEAVSLGYYSPITAIVGYNGAKAVHEFTAAGSATMAFGGIDLRLTLAAGSDDATLTVERTDGTPLSDAGSVTVGILYFVKADASSFMLGSVAENTGIAGFSAIVGEDNSALGSSAMAVGTRGNANGAASIAQGVYSGANGTASAAFGVGSRANGLAQAVVGMNNVVDYSGEYAFIVGNGVSPSRRSNAFGVKWDGTVVSGSKPGITESVTIGGTSLDITGGIVTGASNGDVAWTTLPLGSACVQYSAAYTPRYRRWGPMVQVVGAVKPTAEVASGGTMTIATLPEGCRPSQQIAVLCQGASNAIWLLQITTAGVMTASRYRSGATSAAMPTSAWLVFNATFLVA